MVRILDDRLWFPPVSEALDDGLLAIGGNLDTDRILLAYYNGIFPWFNEGEIPMWWSPDPRFVLFPDDLKVSKSMKQLLKRKAFVFKTDTAFETVVQNCRAITRKDQDGTWISTDVVAAYTKLHEMGYAHSGEAWLDGKLVGGLYGIRLGKVFFGESMFAHVSNASKYAFISLVQQLKADGVALIDCQVHTEHLESLGAQMIPRTLFMEKLAELIV